MPKLTINNKEIEVQDGTTVMQACEKSGVEVPHFCYHKRLEIAGNCRMCLVEMEKSPKLVASCAMPAGEGMVIHTDTTKVRKAREGVMEFLLINHPLDCPICDQGGECDLQDQAFKYGAGTKRFEENKRSVKDKNLGPLVKTHMTRCIHCTRCIRFATDVAGVEEIGATGRGEHMEIVSYLEKTLTSELSGNVVDLCPVGALTSKPYAFNARSWELKKTESIDIMDALGSAIRIDSRGLEVMRILPRENDDVNQEWISDKARFSYDGLKLQRLDRPYIRVDGKLRAASWEDAYAKIANKSNEVHGSEIAAIAGDLCSLEPMFLLKKLLNQLGSELHDANQHGLYFDASKRSNYIFNTEIKNIDQADFCLLIGANTRHAAPVLNARIGQRVRSGKMHVARIGEEDDQTYKINELGIDISVIESFVKDFSKDGGGDIAKTIKSLKAAKNPMIIIGDGVLAREDAAALLAIIADICDKYRVVRENWNGFNIMQKSASSVGALDIGFTSGVQTSCMDIISKTSAGKVKFLYLMGADEIDVDKISDDCFVVYQGHHGEKAAARADVILPEAAWTEQDGIFVNIEGRVQYAKRATETIGEAKESFRIIMELAKTLKVDLGFDMISGDLQTVRELMAAENEIFADAHNMSIIKENELQFNPSKKSLLTKPLEKIIVNYYLDNIISRASLTMSKCVKALHEQDKGQEEEAV